MSTLPIVAKSEEARSTEQLESLSAAILNLINERAYDSPLFSTLSPTFITEFERNVVGRTRDQHIREMKAVVEQNPDIHMEITNMSSTVNEQKGLATVWATQRVTNFPHDDTQRERVKMLVWERRHGERICLKHVGMRGFSVHG